MQSTETENSSFQKPERWREKSDGQTIHPSNSHVRKFSYKIFSPLAKKKKTHFHKTLDITRLRGDINPDSIITVHHISKYHFRFHGPSACLSQFFHFHPSSPHSFSFVFFLRIVHDDSNLLTARINDRLGRIEKMCGGVLNRGRKKRLSTKKKRRGSEMLRNVCHDRLIATSRN